jgi:predicted enzyme related to lactoylglutathione lyase
MARGEITHVEIPADDIERAKRFYAAVAGWEIGETQGYPDYHMFRTAERAGGAIGKRGESVGATLRIYITVDRLEDAVAAAEQNGGATTVAPVDIPGMGRYAAVRDTEGNEVGLWENPAQG